MESRTCKHKSFASKRKLKATQFLFVHMFQLYKRYFIQLLCWLFFLQVLGGFLRSPLPPSNTFSHFNGPIHVCQEPSPVMLCAQFASCCLPHISAPHIPASVPGSVSKICTTTTSWIFFFPSNWKDFCLNSFPKSAWIYYPCVLRW